MSNRSKYIITTVCIDELRKDMTILAYTGFSEQYEQINETVCRFLHLNFGGAKAIILRGGKKLKTSVENIRSGDTLLQLYAFPVSKRKYTRAEPKLIAALKQKGILSFKIKQIRKVSDDFSGNLQDAIHQVNLMMRTPSKRQEHLERAVFEANLLVEKVKSAVKQHNEGTMIIEDMMDSARNGHLQSRDIENYVESVIRHSSSEAMSAIINLRASDQTYSHCIDVGVLFQHLYALNVERKNQVSVFQTKNQALLGAFLHDFGKSQLPKELLDSTARFETESKEMELIRSHPNSGAKLLKGMNMPDPIINMCLCHHVKLDETLNSSYPSKISYAETRFESRLLSLVDIYQALVGRRKYKRSWTPPQAMRYLSALAGIEYDFNTWELFLSLMGEYPIGSLVVLSDNSMGFVMSVPIDVANLMRPQVVIIKNSNGEDLEKHTLLDLDNERDISIKNDVDVTEVFSNQALKRFSELKVVA